MVPDERAPQEGNILRVHAAILRASASPKRTVLRPLIPRCPVYRRPASPAIAFIPLARSVKRFAGSSMCHRSRLRGFALNFCAECVAPPGDPIIADTGK